MAQWLSFWNEKTRRRNEPHLHGGVVQEIYVPYGKGQLKRGDAVYCVGIEQGELYLITRLRVAALDEDPDHPESVLVDGYPDDEIEADYDRLVDDDAVETIEFLHTDGSAHGFQFDADGWVSGKSFQGRASLRELSEGAEKLDRLLA